MNIRNKHCQPVPAVRSHHARLAAHCLLLSAATVLLP